MSTNSTSSYSLDGKNNTEINKQNITLAISQKNNVTWKQQIESQKASTKSLINDAECSKTHTPIKSILAKTTVPRVS